jgi:hypothetical protein
MTQEVKYVCKACGVSMSTGIPLSTRPAHKCQKRANRLIELEPQDEIRNSERRQDSSGESL